MNYNQEELMEMEQDFINMDRDRVRQICHEIMKDELFEGRVAKEELKLLKEGHTVLMPRDVEHAHIMLRVASFYLSQNDPSFKLKNFK